MGDDEQFVSEMFDIIDDDLSNYLNNTIKYWIKDLAPDYLHVAGRPVDWQ